ncbi:hypothetical protein NEOLEDRAFT_1242028 [Neolentinus lepideus HHB14362 ss-1]|uniref:Uncharacterized protein n=1 Tax=Neolentinus lepideus HHB14362 ss-1 TaxID=1314782 RepID=A0A165SBI1_9AGAM|nr:hypothetical protein NEOLEDRAFT_1242028 [Neolentinus lepideus HHB14362 ss-1]
MPRITAAQQKKKTEVDELEVTLSQQSASSDDSGNMLAVVAQQMQASWEKKKKEKETKFLQLAKRELEKDLTAHATRLAKNTEEMNKAYETFVAAYAAAEDEIRALWVAIADEQEIFVDLARRKLLSSTAAEQAREDAQLGGMAACKRACEDLGSLIGSLSAS